MAIINAPVTIANVASIVRSGGTDLADIIANGNINKWAKYKPIVRATVDTVSGQWDRNNNTWLASANWWRGGDGHCGLTFSVFSDLGTLTNSSTRIRITFFCFSLFSFKPAFSSEMCW